MAESYPCEKNDQRITSLEARMKNVEKKADDQLMKTPVLETLMQQVIKTNEKQTETMNEMSITLVKVNNNLDNLNKGHYDTQHQIKTIKDEMCDIKQKITDESDKSKIDTRDIIKNFFLKVFLPFSAGIGVLAGILKALGII